MSLNTVKNPAQSTRSTERNGISTLICSSASSWMSFLINLYYAEERKPISSKPANRNQRG